MTGLAGQAGILIACSALAGLLALALVAWPPLGRRIFGRGRGDAFSRLPATRLGMLGPRAQSAGAAQAIEALGGSVESIAAADAAAREHLRVGEDLMASDLLFAEGRQAFQTLFAHVHELQAAEHALAADERRALARRGAVVLAAWGFIWTAGLLAFARVPGPPDALPEPAAPDAAAAPAPPAPRPVEAIDLDEAAAICTALSRLTTTAGLPDLLVRTARLLEASGLIVWLGAGEDLFAATSHGYDPRVVARLGPIRRHADNATAAAWRDGATRVVAGGPGAHGAIVTPLFGPAGCIGVLAAELRNGREADGATRGVTAMIAAQLAAVVAAWPGPSAVEEPAHGAGGGADAGSSDGTATRAATA